MILSEKSSHGVAQKEFGFLITISTCFTDLKLQNTYRKSLFTNSPKSDYKVGF